VRRKLNLLSGVYSVLLSDVENTDELIDTSVNECMNAHYVKCGDLVVITAGVPAGVAGNTNLIKIHVIGNIIARGMGIGSQSVVGNVCVIRDFEKDKDKFKPGDILVIGSTDKETVPLMEKASAFIVEEGGLTSHAAVVSLVLGKSVIVGAKNATNILHDGQVISMDIRKGLIYNGVTRVL
jgi:pyruvate kinase